MVDDGAGRFFRAGMGGRGGNLPRHYLETRAAQVLRVHKAATEPHVRLEMYRGRLVGGIEWS